MNYLISLLLLLANPPLVDDRDVHELDGFVELNHVYNIETGQISMDQLILWEWNYPTNSHVVKCYYIINDGRRKLSQEEIDNIKNEMINDLLKKLNKKELPPGYEFIFPTTQFVGSKSKVIRKNNDGYTLTIHHDKYSKKDSC